eukprot:TCONS_00014543-protein
MAQAVPPITCENLRHFKLLSYYKAREEGINSCINQKTDRIEKLREQIETNEDATLMRELRNEQSKLRVMKSELLVEDVVKARSLKIFNERCWKAYTPPQS